MSFEEANQLVFGQQLPVDYRNAMVTVPGPADWQAHREEITRLYLTGKKTLNQVMSIMKDKYGFNAT